MGCGSEQNSIDVVCEVGLEIAFGLVVDVCQDARANLLQKALRGNLVLRDLQLTQRRLHASTASCVHVAEVGGEANPCARARGPNVRLGHVVRRNEYGTASDKGSL